MRPNKEIKKVYDVYQGHKDCPYWYVVVNCGRWPNNTWDVRLFAFNNENDARTVKAGDMSEEYAEHEVEDMTDGNLPLRCRRKLNR